MDNKYYIASGKFLLSANFRNFFADRPASTEIKAVKNEPAKMGIDDIIMRIHRYELVPV